MRDTNVYVGPVFGCCKNAKWKYSKACHMFMAPPDSEFKLITLDLAQLHEMAQRLGLKPEYFQPITTNRAVPHYDLTEGKRWQAVREGAIPMTIDEEVEMLNKWRDFNKRFAGGVK